MRNVLQAVAVTLIAATVTACSSSPSPVAPSVATGAQGSDASTLKPGTSTITQLVRSNSDFDVLEKAIDALGLAETLDGKTQYTVFAPTDAAFQAVTGTTSDQAAFDKLLQLFTVDEIKNIVLFHVTNGRRNSTSVLAAPTYQMLNGGTLTREKLTAAGILTADVSASNGIVHVIGGVLLP